MCKGINDLKNTESCSETIVGDLVVLHNGYYQANKEIL